MQTIAELAEQLGLHDGVLTDEALSEDWPETVFNLTIPKPDNFLAYYESLPHQLISTREIAKRVGTTSRKVLYLAEKGYVTPMRGYGEGSGTTVEWAEYQVGEIVEQLELNKTVRESY